MSILLKDHRNFALCSDATKQASNVASQHKIVLRMSFYVATQQNDSKMLRRDFMVHHSAQKKRLNKKSL